LKWRDLIYSRNALKVLPEADVLVTNSFWLPVLSRSPERGKICVHVSRYPKGQIKFYGNAARLHAVSHAIEEAISKEAPDSPSRIRVIPNFVDTSEMQSCDGKRKQDFLFVGRLHPEKGIHILLDAFDKLVAGGLRDWRLRIVGPWEIRHGGGGWRYFQGLRDRSEKLGDSVSWEGPVFDAADLRACYRASSVFVYPSLAEHGETFGLAPLEAMAAGCPPVVSSLECFRDFIKPGFNGWTFNHRSIDASANLANALKNVISETDTLARVRECALRTAKEFTLLKVADQYLSDFEEIVRR